MVPATSHQRIGLGEGDYIFQMLVDFVLGSFR